LEEAIKAGAAEGVRQGTAEVGGVTGVAGDIVANMLEGEGFRKALGSTLLRQKTESDSLLNVTMTDLMDSSAAASEKFNKSLLDIEKHTSNAAKFGKEGLYQAAAGSSLRAADAKKARNDAIKSQAKTAGAMAGIQGAIRAFESGEGAAGVAKTGISSTPASARSLSVPPISTPSLSYSAVSSSPAST
ncbi:MAG: hypothetical protein EBW86_13300, partial [Rhodobacteraceae bacterium]|nr:hypothetical protein [Paracoccaceae bacterium]